MRAIALACTVAAALAGCGSQITPVAGSTVPAASPLRLGRGVADQAREPYFACLRAAGLPVAEVGASPAEVLQVGALPAGPTIDFASTPGGAQQEQMTSLQAQGAEVIGAALLYVHQAPDTELSTIEKCLDQGVKG